MIDKVEVMVTSPKILALDDTDIFTYFQGKYANYSISKDWISIDDFNGMNVKIFKTGIAKIKQIFEGTDVNEKLAKSANTTQKIASELFKTNAIYNVFIYKNQFYELTIPTEISRNNTEIESRSFKIDNCYVDIKITSSGYWITIKEISNIDDIAKIYSEINRKLFQKYGPQHLN